MEPRLSLLLGQPRRAGSGGQGLQPREKGARRPPSPGWRLRALTRLSSGSDAPGFRSGPHGSRGVCRAPPARRSTLGTPRRLLDSCPDLLAWAPPPVRALISSRTSPLRFRRPTAKRPRLARPGTCGPVVPPLGGTLTLETLTRRGPIVARGHPIFPCPLPPTTSRARGTTASLRRRVHRICPPHAEPLTRMRGNSTPALTRLSCQRGRDCPPAPRASSLPWPPGTSRSSQHGL